MQCTRDGDEKPLTANCARAAVAGLAASHEDHAGPLRAATRLARPLISCRLCWSTTYGTYVGMYVAGKKREKSALLRQSRARVKPKESGAAAR